MVQETFLVWINIGLKSGEFDYTYVSNNRDGQKSLVMLYILDFRF